MFQTQSLSAGRIYRRCSFRARQLCCLVICLLRSCSGNGVIATPETFIVAIGKLTFGELPMCFTVLNEVREDSLFGPVPVSK